MVYIEAGPGNDLASSGRHNDTLRGGTGNETLSGESGLDHRQTACFDRRGQVRPTLDHEGQIGVIFTQSARLRAKFSDSSSEVFV
jgi:hypothetical protein